MGQHRDQPTAQNPMLISSQVHREPTDVRVQGRTTCASCMNVIISHLDYQLKNRAHFAILKALLMPFSAMICVVLGQLLQQTASASKEKYQASLIKSFLAGLIGGQCLVGSVIFLNIVFDTGPTPGRSWHRHFTFTSMITTFFAAGAAGPLGAKIINAEDPNVPTLDPLHTFYSSSLGAGLLLWILIIIKALLLSHRKLDTIDSFNTTTTLCTEIDWDACLRCCKWCDCDSNRSRGNCDCHCCRGDSCKDWDCNCCRGCTDCDCCHGCSGCGGCGGCGDCNC